MLAALGEPVLLSLACPPTPSQWPSPIIIMGPPLAITIFIRLIRPITGRFRSTTATLRRGHTLAVGVMEFSCADEVRTVVVLSGTRYFGSGDKWNESKFKAYLAATFYSGVPD